MSAQSIVALLRGLGREVVEASPGRWRLDGKPEMYDENDLRRAMSNGLSSLAAGELDKRLMEGLAGAINYLAGVASTQESVRGIREGRELNVEMLMKADDEEYHFHVRLVVWRCDQTIPNQHERK